MSTGVGPTGKAKEGVRGARKGAGGRSAAAGGKIHGVSWTTLSGLTLTLMAPFFHVPSNTSCGSSLTYTSTPLWEQEGLMDLVLPVPPDLEQTTPMGSSPTWAVRPFLAQVR